MTILRNFPRRRQAAMTALGLCFSTATAAEEAEQRVVFQSGMTVIARVITDDGKTISINPGHGEMAFPRSMIREILPYNPEAYREVPVPPSRQPDTATRTAAPAPSASLAPLTPPAPLSRRQLGKPNADDAVFLLEGDLTWGFSRSTVTIDSSITQTASGSHASGSGSASGSSLDQGPGIAIRGLFQWGDGAWRPLAGLQISTDEEQFGDYTGRAYSVEMVGGVRWNVTSATRWKALFGVGLNSAPWSLNGTISNPSLGTETYDASGTARGPLVRCEIGPSWDLGGWQWGLLTGVIWRSLEGSSTWTSSSGGYSGEDTLTIHAYGGYAGISAGHSW